MIAVLALTLIPAEYILHLAVFAPLLDTTTDAAGGAASSVYDVWVSLFTNLQLVLVACLSAAGGWITFRIGKRRDTRPDDDSNGPESRIKQGTEYLQSSIRFLETQLDDTRKREASAWAAASTANAAVAAAQAAEAAAVARAVTAEAANTVLTTQNTQLQTQLIAAIGGRSA